MDKRPSMLKATMIGGATAGVLAALPVIQFLNCACCALVIGGGFLAAYLYSRQCSGAGVEFRPGNGALVGLVAGLFYAAANSIVSTIIQAILGGSIEDVLEQIESSGVEIPPEAEEWIEYATSGGPFLILLIGFGFPLLVAAIFSTIGGLIGGAVFKVEMTPPAPPGSTTQPPPAAPPAGSPPPPPVAPPAGTAPPAGP